MTEKVTFPSLMKPARILGHSVDLRNATPNDAEFILGLRVHPKKGKYLSKTSADVSAQVKWLQNYEFDEKQVYFIIEDKSRNAVGTVRLYDVRSGSFCWGSWIICDGKPHTYAIESAMMVYEFALLLGFNMSHFDVRRDNESVWHFHERFGATRVGETADDYFYEISRDIILKSLKRYGKYLPNRIEIVR
jgi:RimJ/RimL family protein N-acetyltransferase